VAGVARATTTAAVVRRVFILVLLFSVVSLDFVVVTGAHEPTGVTGEDDLLVEILHLSITEDHSLSVPFDAKTKVSHLCVEGFAVFIESVDAGVEEFFVFEDGFVVLIDAQTTSCHANR
jgi:hypothetical protein